MNLSKAISLIGGRAAPRAPRDSLRSPRRELLLTLSVLMVSLVGFAVGCKGQESTASTAASASAAAPKVESGPIALNGAGATFPYPLYSKWMSEYGNANPDVRINYQSIGSGGGIKQVTAGTVDFGATDVPMSEEEATAAPGKLLHIPTTLGAVVIAYNLPDVKEVVTLSGSVIADVYLGKIKKWNDPAIAKLNDGVKLPAIDIAAVFRSDGSGTTGVFTDYLVKVSPEFKEKVGAGKSVKWPAGLGAKGNEGVTGQVKTTPGGFGYVELAYAMQNQLPTARLMNKAGKVIEPKIESITAAGASAPLGENLYGSITDAEGDASYPISSYTYLLVFEDTKDARKGEALAKFLWWAIHDGQKLCEALHYAPLPETLLKKIDERLKTLRSGDKKLLAAN